MAMLSTRSAAALATRTTCRVCELSYPSTTDRPALLCPSCAGDLAATRAHIADVWDAAERAYVAAQVAVTTPLNAADAATQARYTQVRAALTACLELPDAALTRRLDATEAQGDALSVIVQAERALIVAKYTRTRAEAWARRALAEVAAWEDDAV